MAASRSSRKTEKSYVLDSEPHAEEVRRARASVRRSLSRYRSPEMSREQLRALVDRALPDISLTEIILKERDASW